MADNLIDEAVDRAFDSQGADLSFDEFRNQEAFETNDGEFFDALDEAFGIVPRTDKLVEE